jgi:hypothetical protein
MHIHIRWNASNVRAPHLNADPFLQALVYYSCTLALSISIPTLTGRIRYR